MHTIYILRQAGSPRTYVGQTTRTLKQRFSCWRGWTRQDELSVDIRRNPFDWTITPLQVVETQEKANFWETFWILATNSLYPNGYNRKRGGPQTKHSEYSIQKMKAIVKTPEWRQKISKALKGRKATPAQLEILRAGASLPKNQKGERNGRSKVTAAQVAEIRTLLEQGKTQEEVASMFGIKQVTVSAIKRGKTWK